LETPFGILCFLLWAAIALCAFIFWIWVLIDCLTNEASEGNDKTGLGIGDPAFELDRCPDLLFCPSSRENSGVRTLVCRARGF
jgi:hypothetical protein